jgi:hypothetical protein
MKMSLPGVLPWCRTSLQRGPLLHVVVCQRLSFRCVRPPIQLTPSVEIVLFRYSKRRSDQRSVEPYNLSTFVSSPGACSNGLSEVVVHRQDTSPPP